MADTPDPLESAWREIRELGLEAYIADLETHGFTVVPPERAMPSGLADRLLEAVLDVAERRHGVRPNLETGEPYVRYAGRFARPAGDEEAGEGFGAAGSDSPFGYLAQSLIFEGRVFEEALMNRVTLALATYLLGYSAVMSSMGAFLKGPNESSLDFHTDTLLPSPLPSQALVCNATYVLTDFDREQGSTGFVPGSHKWCRGPQGEEIPCGDDGNPQGIAVEAKAGSLVFWHGNTWHGAYNRRAPGLRVSMPLTFCRPYMRSEEDLVGRIPQEMLDRNNARFAMLTQQGIYFGYRSEQHAAENSARAGQVVMAYAEESGGLNALDPLRFTSHS